MKKIIALASLALLLAGMRTAEATTLPWATLSALAPNVTEAFTIAGCSDARPIGVFVVLDGSDTYYLIVNEDIRWAILGPADAAGKTRIWYGTVVGEDRLLIEHVLAGTPETDVCPYLVKDHA